MTYPVEHPRAERRESWYCCTVLHGGEGPETTTPTRIVGGRHDITAFEAAEWYAMERMGEWDERDNYDADDHMHVAVYDADGRSHVFKCYKRVMATIETRPSGVRTDLVNPSVGEATWPGKD